MFYKINKGFTLIEILVVAAVIGILATVILVSFAISAKNKAAVGSYKSSMKSVQTAVEMCNGSGGTAISGASGEAICGGSEVYPKITSKCGIISQFIVNGAGDNWMVTTDESCRGCRLECRATGCSEVEDEAGDCY